MMISGRGKIATPILWATALLAVIFGALLGALAATAWRAAPADSSASATAPADAENAPPPNGPPPALVRVGHAQTTELQDRFQVVGRLQELRAATVAAEVEGKIVELPVSEGDPVTADQTVLATIDGVWSRLNLQAADAEVQAAQATLDQSQRDLRYLEALLTAQSAKPKEVEDARAKVQSDHARLDAAIAARNLAGEQVQRLQVKAPFDGIVVRKLAEVGQWVSQGDPVAQIISRGQIDAVIDVPEQWINQVNLGDSVRVTVEPLNAEVQGTVVTVNPFAPNAARTFPVKIRLDDQQGRLKAGMSVVAHVPRSAMHQRLTVPRDAVLFAPDGTSVWTASPLENAGPTAQRIAVKVLFSDHDRYVVEPLAAGPGPALTDGTPVVIEGAERLFPMQPLSIMPATAADGEATGEKNPATPTAPGS
jgi:RND family efflux transporter MFP subunit